MLEDARRTYVRRRRCRRATRAARSSPSCSGYLDLLRPPQRQVVDQRAELDRGPDAGDQEPARLHRPARLRRPGGEAAGRRRGARRAIAAARERLAGYPAPVAASSRRCSRPPRSRVVITEDHNFWIDIRRRPTTCAQVAAGGRPPPRRRRRAGRRRGRVHARPDELRDALAEPRRRPARRSAAERADEIERQAALQPPAGPRARCPRGRRRTTPFGRFVAKFFGVPPGRGGGPRASCAARPGSAGTRPRDGADHQARSPRPAGCSPGDILVAETTAPPWTPLFATAGRGRRPTRAACSATARSSPASTASPPSSAPAWRLEGRSPTARPIEVDGDAGIVRIV